MTYLGSSRDLDLRSNFEIDILRSICTYFDASRREEHNVAKNVSLASLVLKLFAKNRFLQKKNDVLIFLTSVA